MKPVGTELGSCSSQFGNGDKSPLKLFRELKLLLSFNKFILEDFAGIKILCKFLYVRCFETARLIVIFKTESNSVFVSEIARLVYIDNDILLCEDCFNTYIRHGLEHAKNSTFISKSKMFREQLLSKKIFKITPGRNLVTRKANE